MWIFIAIVQLHHQWTKIVSHINIFKVMGSHLILFFLCSFRCSLPFHDCGDILIIFRVKLVKVNLNEKIYPSKEIERL